jgi:hypothetical protein
MVAGLDRALAEAVRAGLRGGVPASRGERVATVDEGDPIGVTLRTPPQHRPDDQAGRPHDPGPASIRISRMLTSCLTRLVPGKIS